MNRTSKQIKQIVVLYWHGVTFETIGIPHNQKFKYSEKKRNTIINLILKENLQVMIYNYESDLIIFIDNKKFKQR